VKKSTIADCACYPQSNCENQFCVNVIAIGYSLLGIRVTAVSQSDDRCNEFGEFSNDGHPATKVQWRDVRRIANDE